MTPNYRNSCKSCQFLGEVQVNGYLLDLYRCCNGHTILFRWGNEGHQHHAARKSEYPLSRAGLKINNMVKEKIPNIFILNQAFALAKGWIEA